MCRLFQGQSSLSLLADVMGGFGAKNVDDAVVQEHELRRLKHPAPTTTKQYSIRSIEHAKILLEHKDVICRAREDSPRAQGRHLRGETTPHVGRVHG